MASNVVSPQGKRSSFSHYSSPKSSLFIEKAKTGIRRSTPDSEALASSDDEQDFHLRTLHPSTQQAVRSTQRLPWASENNTALQRKASTGGSEPLSPLIPHPVTSPDSNIWPSGALGATRNGFPTLPWNNGIWNNDSQKGLPSRFMEVLPSPTSLTMNGSFAEEPSQSTLRRDSVADGAIPFAIPLHPTLKSYRSQSYSVGQMDQDQDQDQDMANNPTMRPSQNVYSGRTRAGSSYSGLQHRPSRPSMLGEFSADTSILEQLREVDDDEESMTGSDSGMHLSNNQARKMNELAMENAILRQQTALMSQSMGVPIGGLGYAPPVNIAGGRLNRSMQMNDSVLEEADDDTYNEGEFPMPPSSAYQGYGGRRYSEYSANPETQYFTGTTVDQRALGALKKGHWQSSLGFGGIGEAPQSRRHSFADVPRHASMSTGVDSGNIRAGDSHAVHSPYGDIPLSQTHIDNASYFSNAHSRSGESYRPAETQAPVQQGLPNHSHNRVHTYGQSQAHHGQSLYLVTFKAARAEFYYVQDGTGLEISAGDLVIVEADRGTDLGTVAHKNIDWANAKELKEHYVAEHYNWLIMFSRQGQNGQTTINQGAPSIGQVPARAHSGAVGGMGPTGPTGAPVSADPLNGDIKPKMIKRLAQNHEIHTLREKEGNEARAKRMCQQKVIEHHLTMEILDAEFQMDWKKLTFYYFADSYINFNSLVTDLFKIYKTRIWMSAINPASFVSPLAGPQLPSGVGPGALHVDRERLADHRGKSEIHGLTPSSPADRGFDVSWQPQNGILTAPSPGPYGQFWTPQGLNQPSQQSQDYGRATNMATGSHSSLPGRPYHTGLDGRPRSKPEYRDENPANSYTDQLQILQGLSLGPA